MTRKRGQQRTERERERERENDSNQCAYLENLRLEATAKLPGQIFNPINRETARERKKERENEEEEETYRNQLTHTEHRYCR